MRPTALVVTASVAALLALPDDALAATGQDDQTLVTAALLPAGLAVIMASIGLSLTVEDFRRILVAPKGVGIGLVNLVLVSPFLALAIAEIFGLSPVLAVGLVLMGAAPGGALANLLTHLARGETALSVTMTGVSSVLAVVTVPVFLALAIGHFDATGISDDVSMGGTVARVFAITIIPLSLGMLLRARRPDRALALEQPVKRAALVVFALIVAGAIATEWDRLTESFGAVAPAALTLNVAAMTLSFTVARLAGLPDRQSTAIALELGVHNSTLVIAITASIDTELAIPAAVYSLFMFLTGGAFAAFMARRNVS